MRLAHDWLSVARPNQVPPDCLPDGSPWRFWLILAGRGFGKTRAGAEWVRERVKKVDRVNLIAATADDARDIMVEGESGILAICCPDERPNYKKSERKLEWPNGATSLIFTADEPDRLRGKQHRGIWADELSHWRYPDAWDQAKLGLRLKPNPQAVITTTPRPTKVVKDLKSDPKTALTTGTTYDNRFNLDPAFYADIIKRYEGTRLGRQELLAQILADNPGALWNRTMLDDLRVAVIPPLRRVVVAVDPQVGLTGAETGVVAAGVGVPAGGPRSDLHAYILDDLSLRGTPNEWAMATLAGYNKFGADRIVGEQNQGGEMVRSTIATAARAEGVRVGYKAVTAARGKFTRAEPVAALYEQGKVHHVGTFPELEDQLCLVGDALVATERGERSIRDVRAGERVWTRAGLRSVVWAGQTGIATRLISLRTTDNRHLLTTVSHPVYTKERGFVAAENLSAGDTLEVRECKSEVVGAGERQGGMVRRGDTENTGRRLSGAIGFGGKLKTAIIVTQAENSFIARYGRRLTGLSLRDWKFTTRTGTGQTTLWAIWRRFLASSTSLFTLEGGLRNWALPSTASWLGLCGIVASRSSEYASGAEISLRPRECDRVVALGPASRSSITTATRIAVTPTPVYNLQVEETPEFYANGILVHNCEWEPGMTSPDRLDALVWAVTELMLQARSNQAGSW